MTKKFRVAVVGLGVGKEHVKAFKERSEVELVAVCDIDEPKTREIASKYGIIGKYSVYEEMLEKEKPDIVSIATPHPLHVPQAIKALNMGCHLLIEKPLSIDLESCEQLVAIKEKTDKVIYIGQEVRLTPMALKAGELIKSQKLGRISYAESCYYHNCESVCVDTWRAKPENVRNPIFGGGSHPVDLLRSLLGEVEEVFAYANHFNVTYPVDDCVVALLKFELGTVARVITMVAIKRPYEIHLRIHGTAGSFEGRTTDKTANVSIATPGDEECKFKKIETPVETHPFSEEVDRFMAAVKGEEKPLVDIYEGANAVAVGEAICQSIKRHGPVKVKNFTNCQR